MFDALSRAYPAISARDWKSYLLTVLPQYLAEAEGRTIPPRGKRESTLAMDTARMALALEFVMWFATGAGVVFLRECK